MPLTGAERQKRHADKLRETMGEEKYKLFIKNKNKKKYNKLKNNNDDNEDKNEDNEDTKNDLKKPEFVFIELKPLKKRLNPLKKSKLNVETVKIYLKTIKKIYFNYYKKDLDDDTDLMNVLTNKPYDLDKLSSQLSFIKTDLRNIIINNHKDISIIYSVITRIKNFAKTVKELYPYVEQKQNEYNSNRTNKTIDATVKHKINILSFNKDDVLNIINNDNLNLTNIEKLIFGLMLLFPTRRPVDYRKMLITDTLPKKETKLKINLRNNYYYNKQFYFNVTKNKDIQNFPVPVELDLLINKVIKTNITDNNTNKYLLLNDDNKQFSTSGLSVFIMKTFKKVFGTAISAVEIRRLYSTYLKKQIMEGIITEEEHRNICYMMNHSFEENKKYAY
jgi:hypothetical protein